MRSNIFFNLIRSLFLLLTIYSATGFTQGTNSISGFIFGPDRKPVPQMFVELQDDLYRTISRVKTEGSGKFSFYRLPTGRYNIRVRTIGTDFEEKTVEVEIVNISQGSGSAISGNNFQQDIQLRKKASGTEMPRTVSKPGVIFAQEIPPQAKVAYEQGIAAADRGNAADAVKDLEKAIEIFPKYFDAHQRLGEEYVRLKRFNEAYEAARKGTEIYPKGFENWYTAGYSAYYLKEYAVAVTALERAILINPDSINGQFMLGLSLKQAGKYREAEKALVKGRDFAGGNVPEIHWHLALLYTNNLKNYPAAIVELNNFLKVRPDYEEAEKVRGLIERLKVKVKN